MGGRKEKEKSKPENRTNPDSEFSQGEMERKGT